LLNLSYEGDILVSCMGLLWHIASHPAADSICVAW